MITLEYISKSEFINKKTKLDTLLMKNLLKMLIKKMKVDLY